MNAKQNYNNTMRLFKDKCNYRDMKRTCKTKSLTGSWKERVSYKEHSGATGKFHYELCGEEYY